jgi:SOS-response transcriptional repressor LexA
MREALDEIKPLGKYAGAEVERIFDSIRDDTIENFRKLYPLSNPDLVLSRLHLHHGRDKRVEAYVTGPGGGYEVPSQYVGNAASLRAVALAFFFALLSRHPGGLGFVLMDDPILSLDDDHREAWSANVLRASLGSTQVILATHQRQFFNNCRSDFRPGRLIELNPRNRRPDGGRRLTFRPGDRLERAEEIFDIAVSSVPNEMRKYREDLLSTLDTYSPDPVFIAENWKRSLETYTALKPPHILASSNQQNIARMLNDPKVKRVLDAGSHAATEANVSEAMIRECLQVLLALDVHFRKELDRLDAILLRNLRSKGPPPEPLDVPAAAPAPVSADKPAKPIKLEGGAATWTKPVRLKLIGKAAAQTQGCVVDLSEEPWWAELPPGAAVLVVGETLCPVARPGQWVLLDEPTEEVRDGDLVAAMDRSRNAYLRRAWSVGDLWSLAPVNPLAGVGPVNVRKCESELRKVRGIMYGPKTHPVVRKEKGLREWTPHGAFSATELAKHFGIKVTGTSLAPIAVDGQFVLVGPKVDRRLEGITGGSLAVVETKDERVGNVIKRVFPREKDWLLVSPNPIEPREPIAVAIASIRAVWPIRGVLLNAREIDPHATA